LFIKPSLSALTHLKLACNELESIPENIGLLENLMHLDISHNRIQSLPSSIGSLSSLTVLQARDNLLEELPQEIGRLSALSVLDISQNNITVLPAEMLRLANLCHLVTTRCPLITKLPKPAPHNPLSLRESCARSIVRHRIPLDRKLPIHLRNYVVSAKECSMCSKPCYEGTVCRYTLHDRAGQVIPVQYTLCNPHWDDRKELLLAMFSTTNSPALYHYIAENDITYQESNALWMAVEPVSTNHRASLVSPLTVQSSQRKRTIWRRTTDSLLNRQASA
jgi:Leucine-rich repeat (LRR) protein